MAAHAFGAGSGSAARLDRHAAGNYALVMIERFLVAPGHAFSSRVDAWFAGQRHPCAGRTAGRTSPDVEAVRVNNASLCVSKDGFLILDDAGNDVTFITSKQDKCSPDILRALPFRASISKLFFDGDPHRGNNSNYCIWLTDHMPRLCWAAELFPSFPVGLQCHGLNGFQWASMARAGIRLGLDTPIELREGVYQIDDLTYLTSSSDAFVSRLQGGSLNYAKYLKKRLCYSGENRWRKIFVTRPPGTRRTLINYELCLDKILRLGFEVVDPGNLPFDQQAKLFSESTHVVGIHGAALANLVFCAPGTHVIEIFPKDYGTRAFVWISDVYDLNYAPLISKEYGPKPQTSAQAFYQDILLDTNVLSETLEAFVSQR